MKVRSKNYQEKERGKKNLYDPEERENRVLLELEPECVSYKKERSRLSKIYE